MDEEALLEAERQIDSAYRVHPYLRHSYDEAIFHLLASADRIALTTQVLKSKQENALALDLIVNSLRYPVGWITAACQPAKGMVLLSGTTVEEAESLLEEGRRYMLLVAAFSYWRRGIAGLNLLGRHLSIEHDFATDPRYEAYNRLVKTTAETVWSQRPDGADYQRDIHERMHRSHILKAIPTDRALLSRASNTMDEAIGQAYRLPPNWQFAHFSLAEFRQVMSAIRGVAFLWNIASIVAAEHGANVRPFLPFVIRKADLERAVKDVSGLPRQSVRAVISVLEYGSNGIRMPDPALQPLIPIHESSYALSATLMLGTSPERNLIALMNLVPEERATYARLVDEKEALLRNEIVRQLPSYVRPWWGRLSGRDGLPDVDLALLDHSAKCVLFLELKWFVEPAEARETVHRTDDLAKGVKQCNALLEALVADPLILHLIGADESWVVAAVVLTANWIGFADVQDARVPIIRSEHLLRKLRHSRDLGEVCHWLTARAYLPVAGVHYELYENEIEYFGWTFSWYGIRPLVEDDFLPL